MPDTPLQMSLVQTFPSLLQGVLFAAKPLAGQFLPTPSHDSATSHSPLLALQLVAAVATESMGQPAFWPEQVSATSQAPVAARHTTLLGSNPSAGQDGLLPEQTS